jgi:DNA-binding MarR family transcriptional regulator
LRISKSYKVFQSNVFQNTFFFPVKHLILVLANKLQIVGDGMVAGLSVKQWFLIKTIMDLPSDPPPTITQIVKDTDSTRQNVTKMLEIMERDGLVSIEGNETDRRSRRVRVTEAGHRQAKQVEKNAQGFLKSLFKDITPEDLEASGRVILRTIGNLAVMQEQIKETS